jgi:large subunit ribosomal protein L21
MFAVVEVAGMQYKVAKGDVIASNRLDFDKGQSIVLDKVLLYADGKDVKVGNPYLKNVEVKAEVLAHTRGEKTIAYKYLKRKDAARTVGHRQDLTEVKITSIGA